MKTAQINSVEELLASSAQTRQQIINHPLYSSLKTLEDLRTFTETHVFAVWDFMSLLKALQVRLTCTRVPWTPPKSALACRLINEIVLAEESDELPDGEYGSHFQLYVSAMQALQAKTTTIEQFVDLAHQQVEVKTALDKIGASPLVSEFVLGTFEIIRSDSEPAIAAALTLGREDIIPEMFAKFVFDLDERYPEKIGLFRSYVERHIYLDGEQHRPMSYKMLESLCSSDADWDEAARATEASLRARLKLWDGIYEQVRTR
ncbi:MAG TPA: DUF3050 domain-containing protein [Chroococcales cyanobacterium]